MVGQRTNTSLLIALGLLGGCASEGQPTSTPSQAGLEATATPAQPVEDPTATAAEGTATPAAPATATPQAPSLTPTPAQAPQPTARPAPAELSPRQLLIRASLDLRGVRPTEQEYLRVEQDAEAARSLALSFIDDPRFASRVRALYAPVVRTQLDFFPVSAADYGIDDAAAFYAAVGDEALQLISHVAVNDLPWTELVTADYTLANDLLQTAWPLEADAGEGAWVRARYTDGRPAAGLLTTTALWWRYPSDGVNYNRGRANAVSRVLLCNDYASRPVTFDPSLDLTDTDQVNNALKSNPSCINCHATLDPLASHLFGFQYVAKDEASDATWYHPERERLWANTTGTAPAYYGSPSYTLRDLGQNIAADPRFVSCAVQQVYEGLTGHKATIEDSDALTAHREVFLKAGLRFKPLVASVLGDERYASAAGQSEGAIPLRVVSPDLMASQVEALTGYRLKTSGYDLMLLDQLGLRSLAGGLDGTTGAAPAQGVTPTMALVHERLAEGAAWYVAAADATEGAQRRLFTQIDFTETLSSQPEAMAAQVQALHRRLFGVHVAADGPEVNAALDLWQALYEVRADPVQAWAGVLSVLLRDPEFIFY